MRAFRLIGPICLLALAEIASADVGGAVRDAAARVDYGFFTGDVGLILAARDSLGERAGEGWPAYVAAYASYRAASVRVARGQPPGSLTDECERAARSAAQLDAARAEALIVASACAAIAAEGEPLRSVLHWRRARQLFAEARMLDAGNPRLGLVALHFPSIRDSAESYSAADLAAAFRSRHIDDFPIWGEAEALTQLARSRIDAGDVRGARDALEEALLIAPDFAAARDLEEAIGRLARAD